MYFISFEGPEGSGKSTQVVMLADFLREKGFAVVTTREPGGTRIGDQIRDCIHDIANTEMTSKTEVLLYAASRAQLVEQVIEPALAAGKIVLCDRYVDSTLAYQGYGRGLDTDELSFLTQIATGDLKPNLTFLLDLEVERGLDRRRFAREEMNRLDLEVLAFHERVRQGYHALAKAEPERWRLIDADRPVTEVQEELRDLTLSCLEQAL